ncbi:39S ribosomal protein L50, mitochondrial isoform X2 [Zootermopsis nevadensis]|uniref:39S ribosomal protein L50, mitochondrial isoform X2 n=1 Tax=Zootermopsis nevadensis TaxID=136037 RepID=UPI000B8E7743|nr:39S ribosomal protein L50, mitochondrial isoform X2 [Zootermopsis nevadensis]
MAAFIRHGLVKGGQERNIYENILMIMSRNKSGYKPSSKMPYNRRKKQPQAIKLDSTGESIASKGFHRPQTHYNPPQDVADRINSVYKIVTGLTSVSDARLNIPEVKFRFLNACFQEFQYSVPNSLLSTMFTVDDVVEFYKTPVDKIAPLDALNSMKLPENLHIQTEYHRFHPETDTMFGGISAFPKSSTIVTGLKYKKKYKGYDAESPWAKYF